MIEKFKQVAEAAWFQNSVTIAILIAGVLSMLQATLTLPGVAGIILTIGMAVDANVLIFERIREEREMGRPPVNAVESTQSLWEPMNRTCLPLLASIARTVLSVQPKATFDPSGDHETP